MFLFTQSIELKSLAVYLDSDISPWTIDKPWEGLLPMEWSQVCSVCYCYHLTQFASGFSF